MLSAAEHYRVALAPANVNDEIAARGREAGAELGDDPAAAVRTAADRVLPLLDGLSEDMVISYPNGAIRLGDYLETRVLELTVHTLDLAIAIGADDEAPAEALSVTLHLLADLAGAHRSTVTTAINDWIYDGMLKPQPRGLIINKPGTLRKAGTEASRKRKRKVATR